MNINSQQLIYASVILAGGLIAASLIFTGAFSGNRASVAGGNVGGALPSIGNTAGVAPNPGNIVTGQVREFNIVMENNRYNPSRIAVNLGDQVVINFTNLDNVAHAVEIPQFNATVPGGHVFPGQPAQMGFVADKKISTDAATCGGAKPTDKTDDHGEELIVIVT